MLVSVADDGNQTVLGTNVQDFGATCSAERRALVAR